MEREISLGARIAKSCIEIINDEWVGPQANSYPSKVSQKMFVLMLTVMQCPVGLSSKSFKNTKQIAADHAN